MSKFIAKTVNGVFLVLLGVMLLAMSVWLAEIVFSGYVAGIVGCIILASIFFVVIIFKDKFRELCMHLYRQLSGLSLWKMMLILGVVSAVTKIIFVFLFDNNADLHPDMAMYRSFAEQFATQGRITENADYACKHPYTAIFGMVLSPFAKLFGSDTKVFTVALSLLHSIALILVFDILKRYVGKEISFTVMMMYCLLPMGLFQTQLLTHENGLFFFHIVALWVFLKAFDRKVSLPVQLTLIVAAALVLSIGKSINAAGRVLFISFGIYALAKLFENKITIKSCIRVGCVALALIVAYCGSTAAVKAIKFATFDGGTQTVLSEKKVSKGWSLYLGMNYETSGMINKEDADTYFHYMGIEDAQEARRYQIDLIKDRAQQYINDPIKIPIHLFKKVKVLWGSQLLPFAYELGNKINDFVLRGAGGVLYKGFYLFNAGACLMLYSMAFVGIWKSIRKKQKYITPALHSMMAVIGVTLALLLFETTAKYVSHLHIMMFVIVGFVIKDYLANNRENSKNANEMVSEIG